jgi:O-antigen/teichoic acid export membrane protein
VTHGKNISNALYLIVQPLLLNVLSIPATAYIVRSLGAIDYGRWAVGAALVATTSCLTNLGLRPLFIRSVAQEPERASDELAEQFGIRSVLALLAAAIAILAGALLQYPPVVLLCTAVTAIALFITTVAATIGDVLQGLQRIRAFASINFAAGIVVTVATVYAAHEDAGPVWLSAAYIAGPITSVLLSVWCLRRCNIALRVRFSRTASRRLLGQCRLLGASQILSASRDRIEQLLVPRVVGLAAGGYFTAGSILADRLAMIPDGLSTAFYPVIARQTKQSSDSVDKQVARLIIFSLVLCLPAAILLSLLAAPVASILFPKNPDVCRFVMQITCWSVPLLGASVPMTYAMQAAGHHDEAAHAGMRATIVAMAISVPLVIVGHVPGACWSYVLRSGLALLFLVAPFMRAFPSVFALVPAGRIGACALLMAAMLSLWIKASLSLLQCSIGCIVALGVYVVVLAISGVLASAGLHRHKKYALGGDA